MAPSTLIKGLAFVAALPLAQATLAQRASAPNITLDDWSSLPASSHLHWTPCFENYTCARLKVPLDYGNPSLGNTAIAFIQLSATNVTKDTRSLLINPGGPGGSGVEAVLSEGAGLSEVVEGQHNIVGFDPRGVGRSGPVVDCWPDYPQGRAQFENLYYPEISNASSTSTATQFSAAEIFGKACTPIVGGSNGTAAFVSTPAVARDMLSYVKAEQKVTGQNDTKLWYYGVSYGTVLGATFAHLFPDNVGKMVLDGVVDAEDYYNLGWKSNLYDADKALEIFIQSCFEAGERKCSFWGPSVQNISARLDSLLSGLKYSPIPIAPSGSCPLPMLATYSDLKQLILQAMYSPLAGFSNLATILAGLEQGDTTAYAAAVVGGTIPASPCNYNIGGNTSTKDIGTLIKCVDGPSGFKFSSLGEFEEYVDLLSEQSEFFGDVWPNNANGVACRSFDVSLPESGRLQGSITETRHTSNPILFVTTEVDPVAPKRGAYKMSSVFPGSVVLTQNSVGHTAFVSASACFVQQVQAYLLEAELPPLNTTCQPDVGYF
ncbi:TAP-like protein-domain-containing protein [Aspergillus pseudoustus]|uniref:TAP-like protein-domain-containing protein n=1 Tax=Aspergillus pseudoustus TaxID=1810923 RepID=A0ABR4KFU2_9EURO